MSLQLREECFWKEGVSRMSASLTKILKCRIQLHGEHSITDLSKRCYSKINDRGRSQTGAG